MSAAEETLRHFLTLPSDFPLAWDERCETVVHRESGKAVAFRMEIESALEGLFREGLVPPLACVLMGFELLRELAASGESGKPLWREPMARPYAVAHIIEQGGPPRDAKRAEVLLEGLRSGLPREGVTGEDSPIEVKALLMEGRRLVEAGVANANPDEILRRVRTGTGVDVQAAPLELTVDSAEPSLEGAEAVQQLLRTLESDVEYGGLARLARRMGAPLRLPRPAADQDDLPIGGYADIANRGEIDRLLLSELAQDDDVIASRIVLGEALFLRREVPKDVPRQDLMIVVDSGIRTWGLPRMFATAAALALAASADAGATASVVRANGSALDPMDLTQREGLMEHMGALVADPHPGLAVLRAAAESGGSRQVLVTTRAAFQGAELRAALAESGSDWAVVTVDGDGNVDLFEHTGRGAKLVSSAQLSLEDISARGDGPSAADLRRSFPDLPAYVHESPSPLRLGHGWDRAREVLHPKGRLVLTKRGQVMFWDRATIESKTTVRHGALELGLAPRGIIADFAPLPRGAIVVTHDAAQGQFHVAEFSFDRPLRVEEYALEGPLRLTVRGRDVFVLFQGQRMKAENGFLRPFKGPVDQGRGELLGEPSSVGHNAGRVSLSMLQKVNKVGIEVHEGGASASIHLQGKSVWTLTAAAGEPLRLERSAASVGVPMHSLERLRGEHRAMRFLRGWQFQSGACAWVDRRGLLHLKSGSPEHGELTVTLDVIQPVAAWGSLGWTYHQGEEVLGRPELRDKTVRWLMQFAQEQVVTRAAVPS